MAVAMMLVTAVTPVSHELRLGLAGELGCSSSSSDSIRRVSRGCWWSGSFTEGNDRRCFSAHGFCREGIVRARERRNSNGGGGSRGWGFRERERSREYPNRIVMRSGGDKNDSNLGDDQVETLFMRELRRRGMSSKEKDGAPLGTDTTTKEESEGGGSFFRGWARTKPSPQLTESQRDEQLKRSMALNSEGLDGLIPRGTELLKLGSTFFLAFWPFILAIVAAFGAVYLYFGSAFIHTGNSFEEVGRPLYVDPYQILEEPIPPQVGPNRVPYNAKAYDTRTDGNSP